MPNASASRALRPHATRMLFSMLALACVPQVVSAQTSDTLAEYFGFDPMRVVAIGEGCGPAVEGDFNDDGRMDLAVVNNRRSRIELLITRQEMRSETERRSQANANEIPPSPWYDNVRLSVSNRITAVLSGDVNRDGRTDIICAGSDPAELLVYRQASDGSFALAQRMRAKGLANGTYAVTRAELSNGRFEVLAVIDSEVHRVAIGSDGRLQEPVSVGGDAIGFVMSEDVTGDGIDDIIGGATDDSAPVRIWPRFGSDGTGVGAELRFSLPPVNSISVIPFEDRKAASLGVIERATRRMVYLDLVQANSSTSLVDDSTSAAVYTLPGADVKDRSIASADLSGDGNNEIVVFDQSANTIEIFAAKPNGELQHVSSSPTFKQPKQIVTGAWSDGNDAVFVLSEAERTVGVSTFDDGRLTFPEPITLKNSATTPVVMSRFSVGENDLLAVVTKDRRDYEIELVDPSNTAELKPVTLKDVRRDPAAILPIDIDANGTIELLLLTPGEPMVVVPIETADGKSTLGSPLTKDTMLQFGLVEAAAPANTLAYDFTGDGQTEMLVADANFVRVCRYDNTKGWRVIEQLFVDDATVKLTALTILGEKNDPSIVAWDRDGKRVVVFARDAEGRWGVRRMMNLTGFDVASMQAFPGASGTLLCVSDGAVGVVSLGGTMWSLEEFASARSESDDRFEHDIIAGDINGDGYTDAVVLDASERMCSIYSFSAARKLIFATEFEIYQSRLFTGGASRQFEPSQAIITDLTGDGKNDIAMICHDRVLIYPQAAK
ncbi:MAG: VCBS repeat-containing protein [Phycisphaeraceae bacterium]|nr:VCBS repeat-containing protein [Phycisphaerales bacterium]MCB9861019.1 VCBS repeat-containing protein [Phycisphaeraceae bacterium]